MGQQSGGKGQQPPAMQGGGGYGQGQAMNMSQGWGGGYGPQTAYSSPNNPGGYATTGGFTGPWGGGNFNPQAGLAYFSPQQGGFGNPYYSPQYGPQGQQGGGYGGGNTMGFGGQWWGNQMPQSPMASWGGAGQPQTGGAEPMSTAAPGQAAAAPGQAAAAPAGPDHAANFRRLMQIDPRLAYGYTSGGNQGAADWYRQNQLQIATDYFGAPQGWANNTAEGWTPMNQWINQWGGGNNNISEAERAALGRMAGGPNVRNPYTGAMTYDEGADLYNQWNPATPPPAQPAQQAAPPMSAPQGWSNQGLSPQDQAFFRQISNSNPGNQNALLDSLMSKEQINSSMFNNPFAANPASMAEYINNPANARMLDAARGFGYGNSISDYANLYGPTAASATGASVPTPNSAPVDVQQTEPLRVSTGAVGGGQQPGVGGGGGNIVPMPGKGGMPPQMMGGMQGGGGKGGRPPQMRDTRWRGLMPGGQQAFRPTNMTNDVLASALGA